MTLTRQMLIGVQILLLVCPTSLYAGPDGDVDGGPSALATTADIVQAWKQREEYVRTCHFRWQNRRCKAARAEPGLPPRNAVAYECEFELSFDGRKFQYAILPIPFHAKLVDAGVLREYHNIYDDDKKMEIRYFGSFQRPNGDIRSTSDWGDKDALSITPFMLTFRPNCRLSEGPPNEPRWPEFSIVERKAQVKGVPCLRLSEGQRVGLHHDYWVGSFPGFPILRYVSYVSGQECCRIEIDYKSDKLHGWIPDHWTYTMITPQTGAVRHSGDSTVTTYTINERIPASRFEATFPVGTIVENEITGERYIAGPGGTKERFLK